MGSSAAGLSATIECFVRALFLPTGVRLGCDGFRRRARTKAQSGTAPSHGLSPAKRDDDRISSLCLDRGSLFRPRLATARAAFQYESLSPPTWVCRSSNLTRP